MVVKDEREEDDMGDMVEERCNRSYIAFSYFMPQHSAMCWPQTELKFSVVCYLSFEFLNLLCRWENLGEERRKGISTAIFKSTLIVMSMSTKVLKRIYQKCANVH